MSCRLKRQVSCLAATHLQTVAKSADRGQGSLAAQLSFKAAANLMSCRLQTVAKAAWRYEVLTSC